MSFKYHRFPPQIVSHAVWLYLRFNLSFREVEEMLLELGIDVSYETVHRWVKKFGPNITRNLRRRQPKPGDIWHLDEVAVKCGGEKLWLWCAVNQFGTVLEEILQKRRDKKAAKADVASGIEHWSHKGLNNRADNSHLPYRKRERTLQRYQSPGALQRFVTLHSATRNCFPYPPAAEPPSQFVTIVSKLSRRGTLRHLMLENMPRSPIV
ncbi:IS6 family transposase [Pectobacterium carotovorum]